MLHLGCPTKRMFCVTKLRNSLVVPIQEIYVVGYSRYILLTCIVLYLYSCPKVFYDLKLFSMQEWKLRVRATLFDKIMLFNISCEYR
jgi:hypothetical protein